MNRASSSRSNRPGFQSLPLISCVTLDKVANFSNLLLHLENVSINTNFLIPTFMNIKWDNKCKSTQQMLNIFQFHIPGPKPQSCYGGNKWNLRPVVLFYVKYISYIFGNSSGTHSDGHCSSHLKQFFLLYNLAQCENIQFSMAF